MNDFMRTVIQRLESEGRYGTAHVYECVLNAISQYWNERQKGAMKLERIFTPGVVQGFEKYLLENKRSASTVSRYQKALQAMYHIAVEEKKLTWRQGMFSTLYIPERRVAEHKYRWGMKEGYKLYSRAQKNFHRKLIQIIQKLNHKDRFLPYSIPYAKAKINLSIRYFANI